MSPPLHCIALTFLASGCSVRPEHDPDLTAIVGTLGGDDGPAEAAAREHDFGTILAFDQTLHHNFIIKNPSDRPIQVRRATALTPCCSSIGPVAEVIPSRGKIQVPVALKADHRSGMKAVQFLVEVDDKKEPVRVFALRVRTVSACEVERTDAFSTTLPLGQAGKQTFRVTTRRKGAEGRDLPAMVTASPPLIVAFDGEGSTKSSADGLIESTRHVIVTIPAGQRPGIHRGEMRLDWTDGGVQARPISWEVRPRLRVSPAGLVLRPTRQPVGQVIVLESDGRPFLIREVVSPLLAGTVDLPSQAAVRQQVALKLDPSRADVERAMEVRIRTDHPDHPVVSLTVMVLRASEGA